MSLFARLFKDHPASVGETYSEHAVVASGIALRLVGAGLACMIHALLPFLFKDTGSTCIRELHGYLSGRNNRRAAGLARTLS